MGSAGGVALIAGGAYYYKKNSGSGAAGGGVGGKANFFRYEDGAADVPGEGLEMDEAEAYRVPSPTKLKYEAQV